MRLLYTLLALGLLPALAAAEQSSSAPAQSLVRILSPATPLIQSEASIQAISDLKVLAHAGTSVNLDLLPGNEKASPELFKEALLSKHFSNSSRMTLAP